MIRVTYEFETEEQALVFLTRGGMQLTNIKRPPSPPKAEVAEVQPVIPIPLSNYVENAPARVEAVPKIANQPVQAIPAALPTPKAPTIIADVSTVRAVLREVFNLKGAKVATDLLKQFGASRIGDLKPEQYIAFAKAGVALQGPDSFEEQIKIL